MMYPSITNTRINSIIGKKIEGIKVEIKRAQEDLKRIGDKKKLNICEIFLLNNGRNIINKANEGICRINDINFINLVERSMKKNELCIGRIDEGNLRVMDRIEIGTLKNLYFNLVEEDVYEYLKKLKRKRVNLKLDNLIDEYISVSNLSNESKNYINSLLCIPYDTLRQWRKFRNNKKKLSPNEYLKGIENSSEYEFAN